MFCSFERCARLCVTQCHMSVLEKSPKSHMNNSAHSPVFLTTIFFVSTFIFENLWILIMLKNNNNNHHHVPLNRICRYVCSHVQYMHVIYGYEYDQKKTFFLCKKNNIQCHPIHKFNFTMSIHTYRLCRRCCYTSAPMAKKNLLSIFFSILDNM